MIVEREIMSPGDESQVFELGASACEAFYVPTEVEENASLIFIRSLGVV